MSFLDTAKQTANKLNANKPTLPGVAPKPNITSKPAIPGKPNIPGKPPGLNKPTIPSKPVVKDEPKVTESDATNKSPLTKNNPFIKKDTAPIAPVIEEKKEVTQKIAPVIENKESTVKIAPVIENKPVTEKTIEKAIDSSSSAPAETTEQEVKKTTRKTRSSKKKETKADEDASTENQSILIAKSEVSYEEAIQSIRSGFIDEEWENFKKQTSETIDGIVIQNNMTPTMIKNTLADLSSFRDSIWKIYTDTKSLYENLSGKDPEGVIERKKRISAKGSNTEERRLNATIAIINNKDDDGNAINLYEVLDESRERYNYLRSLMEGINYKNSVLVTMLGSIKLEK